MTTQGTSAQRPLGPAGLPAVPLAAQLVALEKVTVDLRLIRWLPEAFVRRYRLLPCGLTGGQVLVLMAKSPDPGLVDELSFVLGRSVQPLVSESGDLDRLIQQAFDAASRGDATLRAEDALGVGGGDLVYLEELGSLGDLSGGTGGGTTTPRTPAPSLAPSLATPPPISVPQATPVTPAPVAAPVAPTPAAPGGSLPSVVDLEPSEEDRAGSLSAPDRSASASLGSTSDSALVTDPGLVDGGGFLADVALLDDLGASDTPQKRSKLGLQAVLAIADPGDRGHLSEALHGLGFDVTAVDGGPELGALLEGTPPALLLLDTALESPHAFSLALRIRKDPRFNGTALVLTSDAYRGWRVAADLRASHGVDGFLEWPIESTLFAATLEQVLAARSGRQVILRDPEPIRRAAAALAQGQAAYKQGNVDQALVLFEAGLAEDPASPPLRVAMAIALVKRQQPYDAMLQFERAIALDPTLTTAARSLAILYEKRGFKHKAVELWEQTLHATGDEAKRREIIAQLLRLLGA